MNRSPMRRKPSRGSGIPPKIREAVLLRDGHHCRRCGRSLIHFPASIQHRLPRGRGGQPTLANLVLVCGSATTPGSCHNWMEHVDRRQATDDGWLCRTGENPAGAPVLMLEGWRHLTDDGRVLTRAEVVSQEVAW